MRRRAVLATLGAMAAGPLRGAEIVYPAVRPGVVVLAFPRDHGAHPTSNAAVGAVITYMEYLCYGVHQCYILWQYFLNLLE